MKYIACMANITLTESNGSKVSTDKYDGPKKCGGGSGYVGLEEANMSR